MPPQKPETLEILAERPLKILAERPAAPAPAPRSSGLASIGDYLKMQLEGTKDVVVGAGKGAASTAIGLSELVNKGTSAIGLSDRIKPEVFDAAREHFTTPTNTAQSIGKGAEQIGEFFIPGGAVTKGAKAVETGVAAYKGAKTLTGASKALLEGLSGASVHSAQTGSTKGAGTVGALGAGTSAAVGTVTAAAGRYAPKLAESAEKKVAQALGATKEKLKAISAKRAPEILKRGLKGSRETLLTDAKEMAKEAGQAVDDVLQTHGAKRLPTIAIDDALDQAKAGYILPREMTIQQAIAEGLDKTPGIKMLANGNIEIPVVLDERVVNHLSALQDTVRKLGPDASVDHLVAVRRAWDEVVEGAGGYAHRAEGGQFGVPLAEQTEAWAKKKGAAAIRELLAQTVPDAAAVNKEFAFWADLRKVLSATQARTQAQGPGLGRIVTATTGAAIGASTGGLATTVAAAVAAPQIMKLLTSPRFRLADARLRNALADALASGDNAEIASAMAKITAAIGSEVQR